MAAADKNLDCFALEGGLLRVGEGILGLERCHGRSGKGLCAALDVSSFFASRLKLLRRAAHSAYLYGTCFGDEIAHTEFSHVRGF